MLANLRALASDKFCKESIGVAGAVGEVRVRIVTCVPVAHGV